MQPQQSIVVQLETAPGVPLPLEDVLLDIKLFTRGKLRYQFKAGRTNANGALVITYAELERQRNSNSEQFLMDYNTPLDDCDPTVELSALSEDELKRAADYVQQSFGSRPQWAFRWPSNKQVDATPVKVDLGTGLTTVTMICQYR